LKASSIAVLWAIVSIPRDPVIPREGVERSTVIGLPCLANVRVIVIPREGVERERLA